MGRYASSQLKDGRASQAGVCDMRGGLAAMMRRAWWRKLKSAPGLAGSLIVCLVPGGALLKAGTYVLELGVKPRRAYRGRTHQVEKSAEAMHAGDPHRSPFGHS